MTAAALPAEDVAAAERVAVVIVNANAGAYLERALEHLERQTVAPARVIVVDNASRDGSTAVVRSRFPWAELVEPGVNLGFAAANNLAIRQAEDCDFVALLNPDAFPEPRWLEALLAAARSHPAHAVFGSTLVSARDPSLLDGTGDSYHVAGIAWRRDQFAPVSAARDAAETFSACAAAALYRRDALVEVGGFDESFFCYYEDTDLAYRLRLAGHPTLHVPEAVALHVGSAVTGSLSAFTVYHSCRNQVWTWVKNTPLPLLLLSLPAHLLLNLVVVLAYARLGVARAALAGKRDAFRDLPRVVRERRAVQARRTVSSWDVLQAMTSARELGRATRRSRAVLRAQVAAPATGATHAIARNVAGQSVARVLSVALSVAITALLTRHLGVAGFGSFVSAIASLALFSFFFDWGTQTMLVRELSDPSVERERVLAKTLALRCALSLPTVGLVAAFLFVLYRDQPQVRLAGLVLLVTIPLGAFASTLEAAFQARLLSYRSAFAQLGAQAASAVAIAVLVVMDAPFVAIVAAAAAGAFAYAGAVFVLARPLLEVGLELDLRFARQLLARSFPLGIALVLNTLYFRIDAVLLVALRGSGEAGLYGVAYRFLEGLLPFGGFLVVSLFPLLSRAAQQADAARLRGLAQRGVDVLVVIALPIVVGVIMYAPQLIRLLAGSRFAAAALPLRIVIVGAGLMFVNGLLGYMVIAIDRQRSALWLNALTLVANVCLNLALIPRFGATGAAAAATASEVVILAGNLFMLRRFAGFAPSLNLGGRAATASLAMAAPLALAHLGLAAGVPVAAATYVAVLVLMRVHRLLDPRAPLHGRLDDVVLVQ